ncbi:ATP phosphoribosyltransferase regulatory subunit [Notoacmeibacter sp. MSK16QG-6]|uniref:ATP phosphoribosyltransferase regulatory subunit n=1 Tax=Notoacmeibacter sp. MSK16QG-6 TaxID=2957982 RepID=UPI00209E2E32|nr:ATP phosphoribosyltransferase regulatory subunit [Notoacmeibacter sp. MSK16QG-6]MCP1198518.1 ATP phosphoribosyltransferase regulatory subunit [Notoacmeibacter sp. MSK16QG-6]
MALRQMLSAAEAYLEEAGAQRTVLPVIQPADPFLDMAGEDLRRRIFLTESETGQALCLRPEFTIPVCLQHLAQFKEKRDPVLRPEIAERNDGPPEPIRYGLCAQVFRQHRDGDSEFFQAGIEDLGTEDWIAADARALADAMGLVARLRGTDAGLRATLGDQAVFAAILDALGLPDGWQMRLLRAFGQPEALANALNVLSGREAPAVTQDERVAGLLAAGDDDALLVHIEASMAHSGISPGAGRRPEEIVARLKERAALAATRLPDDALAALETFIALRVPLAEAGRALTAFEAEAGINVTERIELFAARIEAIRLAGIDLGAITYDAAFGRPLDYYTGLVFEIGIEGLAKPLASGGRYDRLLTLLGADRTIPGVGFVAWLDRIEALEAASE